jgi:hypothetical protein
MTDTQTPNRSGDFSVAYNQLCTSYHAIDDFRAKLLGFLPLVTGGGLVLLTGLKKDVRQEFFAPMGVFGILVTFRAAHLRALRHQAVPGIDQGRGEVGEGNV